LSDHIATPFQPYCEEGWGSHPDLCPSAASSYGRRLLHAWRISAAPGVCPNTPERRIVHDVEEAAPHIPRRKGRQRLLEMTRSKEAVDALATMSPLSLLRPPAIEHPWIDHNDGTVGRSSDRCHRDGDGGQSAPCSANIRKNTSIRRGACQKLFLQH